MPHSCATNSPGRSSSTASSNTTPKSLYSTLTCTLILRNDPDTGRLASATPVWWEYHLHQRDGEVLTDFSWSELSRFLEA
ncbi:MAG: hypothetical protein ACLR8Y_07590 [Alistipes indistinctus]